jgi:hypothetical protein
MDTLHRSSSSSSSHSSLSSTTEGRQDLLCQLSHQDRLILPTEPLDDFPQPEAFDEARAVGMDLGDGSGETKKVKADDGFGGFGQAFDEAAEEGGFGDAEGDVGGESDDFEEWL